MGAAEPAAKLSFVESWGNVFADKDAAFHVQITSKEKVDGTLGWQLTREGRTLLSKETGVVVDGGVPRVVDVTVAVPHVDDGVALPTRLSVTLTVPGSAEPVARAEKDVTVFAADAFAYRRAWAEKLKIRLFDPEKKTGEVLEKAKVPFQSIANVDAFPAITDGLLLIGEGVSFKDYRGLADQATRTAARGIPVLILAPSGGEFLAAGVGESNLPVPHSMALERSDIIRTLDKNLDATVWPPDGRIVSTSMNVRGDRGAVMVDTVKGADGWPWIEWVFAPPDAAGQPGVKTRLVLCGFGIVEKWDSTPAARYLLARVLEHVAGQ